MSPIIATILLSAMVVVLAAVLYVLITGLTHGTGNAPLGSAFAMGVVSGTGIQTGTAATNAYCKTGDVCYSVSIESATGVYANDISVAFKAGGSTYTTVGASDGISILNPSNSIIVAGGALTGAGALVATSWTTGPTAAIAPGDILWVDLGGTMNPSGSLYVTVIAVTGFQGTVTTEVQ